MGRKKSRGAKRTAAAYKKMEDERRAASDMWVHRDRRKRKKCPPISKSIPGMAGYEKTKDKVALAMTHQELVRVNKLNKRTEKYHAMGLTVQVMKNQKQLAKSPLCAFAKTNGGMVIGRLARSFINSFMPISETQEDLKKFVRKDDIYVEGLNVAAVVRVGKVKYTQHLLDVYPLLDLERSFEIMLDFYVYETENYCFALRLGPLYHPKIRSLDIMRTMVWYTIHGVNPFKNLVRHVKLFKKQVDIMEHMHFIDMLMRCYCHTEAVVFPKLKGRDIKNQMSVSAILNHSKLTPEFTDSALDNPTATKILFTHWNSQSWRPSLHASMWCIVRVEVRAVLEVWYAERKPGYKGAEQSLGVLPPELLHLVFGYIGSLPHGRILTREEKLCMLAENTHF